MTAKVDETLNREGMPSKTSLDINEVKNNDEPPEAEKLITKDEFINYLDSHLQHTFAMMQENQKNIEVSSLGSVQQFQQRRVTDSPVPFIIKHTLKAFYS